MKTKNRIQIVNIGLAGGGIERASVSMANFFSSNGFDVSIVALYRSEHFFSYDNRIKFFEPQFNRIGANRNIYLLRMIFYLRRVTLMLKPDVVLAFGEWTNPYVILSIVGLGIPVYVTDRMSPVGKLPLISSFLKKTLYKRASGIIAQTSFAKGIIFGKTGSKNIRVIPNPVNVMDRVDCPGLNRIVTVGRLSAEKGHRFLIEAFAQLQLIDWELSIVGDGMERENLEKLVENLNIADRVIFHGHLKDFKKQLSEASIFVLPSLKEGFPNALIEAMSLPLPCISSDCIAGPSDIIENGVNGLLVEPANVSQLANVLELLIVDSDLREKLANKAFQVRERYDFNAIAKQYLDFIFEK